MYDAETLVGLETLKNALRESDAFKVKAALEELYPAQILEHWSEFAPEHRLPILTLLSPAEAAEVFSHLEEAEQAELLEALPPGGSRSCWRSCRLTIWPTPSTRLRRKTAGRPPKPFCASSTPRPGPK